jgi:hypothetical protein
VSLTDIRPSKSSSSCFGGSGMESSRSFHFSAGSATTDFDCAFFASALFRAIASRMLTGVAGTGGSVSGTGFCLDGVVALDDVEVVLSRGVDGVVRKVGCVRTRGLCTECDGAFGVLLDCLDMVATRQSFQTPLSPLT